MKNNDFPEKLKTLRNHMKMSQVQLAERLGVVKSVISFYESGERFPSIEVLIKIASIFHVSTDYLLGLEKELTLNLTGLSEEEVGAIQIVVDVLRSKNK